MTIAECFAALAKKGSAARNVSLGLMPAEDLKALFESKGLTVTAVISDERMYQVVGCKA